MYSPLQLNRHRAGFSPNQDLLGLGLNNGLIQRRGARGAALSPVGSRYGLGELGGLGGIGNSLVSAGGLGGIGMGGLGGLDLAGIGANALNLGNLAINNLGVNDLGVNGINALPLVGLGLNALALGGGRGAGGLNRLGTQGQLSPFYPNHHRNAMQQPLRRNRVRGNSLLGRNGDNYYVYPPAEDHFVVPVHVQSGLNRRNNGLMGRLCGNNSPSEFNLTIPFNATMSDIFEELNKGKLDYHNSNVFVVTHEGDCHLLDDWFQNGYTTTDLCAQADSLVVVEN